MILYKFLDSASHAQAFLSGNVRFTCLEEYKLTEDELRRDLNEGNVIFNMPKHRNLAKEAAEVNYLPITYQDCTLRPKDWYVLCFSLVSDPPDFNGKCCVCIHDVEAFIKRCQDKINLIPEAEFLHGKVKYYDHCSMQEAIAASRPAQPFVKTHQYAHECEYRLAFWAENRVEFAIGEENNYIHVVSHARIFNLKIGNLSDIAEIIPADQTTVSRPHFAQ